MNKNGLGEPLQMIASVILIVVVLIIGFIIFAITPGSKTTTISGNTGSSSIDVEDTVLMDISTGSLISILNSKNDEYGNYGNLIASGDKDKIKSGLGKLQKEIKDKTGKRYIFSITFFGSDNLPGELSSDNSAGKGFLVFDSDNPVDSADVIANGKQIAGIDLPSYNDGNKIQVILLEMKNG